MIHLTRKALLAASASAALVLGSVLVLAVPATASDLNEHPTNVISGADTQLEYPQAMQIAPDGTTWVATVNSNYTVATVLAFAPGATGDAKPEVDISGDQTLLQSPAGVALDSDGNVWIADAQAGAVYEFAAGLTGNVPPTTVIAGPDTQLAGADGIAVGPDGTIYVASGTSVLVFASGSQGDAQPSRVIAGSNTGLDTIDTWSIALQSDGALVVGGAAGAIETFASGASGNVAPEFAIAGSQTDLPAQDVVAVDPSGNIYAADSEQDGVVEFPQNANGNVAPSIRVVGAASGLSNVYPIATDQYGDVFVSTEEHGPDLASIVEFDQPRLAVSGISPASGPATGGGTVTITGAGFTAGSTVTFGGVAATGVDVVSSTTITATVPPHAPGTVDVAVTPSVNCDCEQATATFLDSYAYDAVLATTGVDPTPGIVAGIILFAIGAGLLIARRRMLSRARSRR